MSNKIKAVVITISDTRETTNDVSGNNLVDCLEKFGAEICERLLINDDLSKIAETLRQQADKADINLIITTGGTGFSPRDNTPEATLQVIEKQTFGISEELRRESLKKTKFAMLSRGVSGIRNNCLIINFPGSPKAVIECFEIIKPILTHAVSQISGEKTH